MKRTHRDAKKDAQPTSKIILQQKIANSERHEKRLLDICQEIKNQIKTYTTQLCEATPILGNENKECFKAFIAFYEVCLKENEYIIDKCRLRIQDMRAALNLNKVISDPAPVEENHE